MKKDSIAVYVTKEVRDAAIAKAEEQGMSLSLVVRLLLQEWLGLPGAKLIGRQY